MSIEIEKNKQIRFLVVGEQGEIDFDFGEIPYENVQLLIDEAEKRNFVCLGLIDLSGDTYFGEKQCRYILETELPVLKKVENINWDIPYAIEKGINAVLKSSWVYLKIGAV